MAIPKWADELATQVCKDYGATKPPINWRKSRAYRKVSESFTTSWGERIVPHRSARKFSSGVTYPTRIGITAGTDRKDQKLVLLHELAHWLTPKEHHSVVFWEKAFELYRRYKVPMRYAQQREYRYRKTARIGYKNSRSKTTALTN